MVWFEVVVRVGQALLSRRTSSARDARRSLGAIPWSRDKVVQLADSLDLRALAVTALIALHFWLDFTLVSRNQGGGCLGADIHPQFLKPF